MNVLNNYEHAIVNTYEQRVGFWVGLYFYYLGVDVRIVTFLSRFVKTGMGALDLGDTQYSSLFGNYCIERGGNWHHYNVSTMVFDWIFRERLSAKDSEQNARIYPNGVISTYEYDGMSRLTRLKDTGPAGTLFDRQYSYNNANQISQIVEPTVSRTFAYDNIDRLISVTNPVNGNESYAFDGVGNRTSSHRSNTYAYQPFNKIASTQTGTYGSDANGNMTSKGEGSNFWRYSWDYENRLSQASSRKQSVRYKYDALGRRVSRVLGNGRENTKFTYDGLDALMDDDSGVLTKYQNGPGIDNKLRTQTGSSINYFLSDHLSSTNGLTDATGAITSQTAYDSFGNQTSTLSTRYGFTGRERDDFSGLMYYRARFYDPNLGRFISEDPIDFEAGDVNLYGYVRNNPISHTDPSGLIDPIIYQDPKIYGANDPNKIQKVKACYQKWKFSSVASLGNPTAEAVLEYVEIGSLSSLASDGVATTVKTFGRSTASKNPYASGINLVGRNINRALGYPRIGGFYPYRYFLKFGNKVTPVLAVTGAFTFSYNVTTDIQCACGLID